MPNATRIDYAKTSKETVVAAVAKKDEKNTVSIMEQEETKEPTEEPWVLKA